MHGERLRAPADVQAGDVQRKPGAGFELALWFVAPQFLHFEPSSVTDCPAPAFLHADQHGFLRFAVREFLRSHLDLIEDSQLVELPLGFQERTLIERLTISKGQFTAHDPGSRALVAQHQDPLDAFLGSNCNVVLNIHLVLRGDRGSMPGHRGVRVSSVREVVEDEVPVGLGAFGRIGL